jgi:hypothetical protein
MLDTPASRLLSSAPLHEAALDIHRGAQLVEDRLRDFGDLHFEHHLLRRVDAHHV